VEVEEGADLILGLEVVGVVLRSPSDLEPVDQDALRMEMEAE